ncbi:methyl-accepting chemotaxis protein [Gymnodinialimonas ceratoperidinii]|uniref:Methyl-accepting chemotaxis protein n=1 Tax=Gymnodinialimonas ceratoperidinii TaxID=2856823 RepID=A0A8F6YBM6_9RHOB|nr:methyl-accepting chemotaxis protein [Gymnodinialimonas ceratoperidinii]QXT40718.1 methyl-accepting chemotaxis protein [Gymnodinialimonas ceratoperidinii]
MDLRTRMALMIAPLLITLGYFVWLELAGLRQDIRNAEATHRVTLDFSALTDLVHELQREQGLSAGFITSNGRVFTDELNQQRQQTDAVREQTDGTLRSLQVGAPEVVASVLADLDQLADQRLAITRVQLDVSELSDYFSGMIAPLQAVQAELAGMITEPRLMGDIQAALHLTAAKETAGQERTIGAVGLGRPQFPDDLYADFLLLRGAMGAQLQNIGQASHMPGLTERIISDESVEAIEQFRGAVDRAMPLNGISGRRPLAWYDVSSAWIDHLRAVEQDLTMQISTTALDGLTAVQRAFWIQLAFALFVAACGTLMAITTFESLIRRLKRITSAVQQFTNGQYDVEIPDTEHSDAVGEMAAAVEEFKEHTLVMRRDAAALKDADEAQIIGKAQRVVDLVTEGLADLARADLTRHFAVPLDPEYDSIRADFNAAVARLCDVMRDIARATGDLGTRAQAMTQSAADLETRTRQQVATLNATNDRIIVLSDEVRDYTNDVQKAAALASAAKSNVERSGDVVVAVTDAMDRIANSSREIERVLMLIDEISHQTNLLALNAGVEAARAGEAGRGFSIVASEVRDLARRSGSAAQEIKSMIDDSTANIAEGVTLVHEAGTVLNEISGEISNVDDVLGRLAEGSSRQSKSLHDLAGEIADVNNLASHNSEMADSSSRTARETSALSRHLNDLLSDFKLPETPDAEASDGRTAA